MKDRKNRLQETSWARSQEILLWLLPDNWCPDLYPHTVNTRKMKLKFRPTNKGLAVNFQGFMLLYIRMNHLISVTSDLSSFCSSSLAASKTGMTSARADSASIFSIAIILFCSSISTAFSSASFFFSSAMNCKSRTITGLFKICFCRTCTNIDLLLAENQKLPSTQYPLQLACQCLQGSIHHQSRNTVSVPHKAYIISFPPMLLCLSSKSNFLNDKVPFLLISLSTLHSIPW